MGTYHAIMFTIEWYTEKSGAVMAPQWNFLEKPFHFFIVEPLTTPSREPNWFSGECCEIFGLRYEKRYPSILLLVWHRLRTLGTFSRNAAHMVLQVMVSVWSVTRMCVRTLWWEFVMNVIMGRIKEDVWSVVDLVSQMLITARSVQ